MEEEALKSPKLKLGEMLLEYGIVTRQQIADALKKQISSGKPIGSVLREMGFLDDHSLLNFLGMHFKATPVNLFEIKVDSDVLKLLPFKRVKNLMAFPIKETGPEVTLAMVNPRNLSAIEDVEFALERRVTPVVVPYYQMEMALAYFHEKGYGHEAFVGRSLR